MTDPFLETTFLDRGASGAAPLPFNLEKKRLGTETDEAPG